MPPPPSVIIIVRHGARLDAADKTWHLSSPTPYDPPLTYGGWTQCRALGTRIASLLHALEEEELVEEDVDTNEPSAVLRAHAASSSLLVPPDAGMHEKNTNGYKGKKRKVIIHTSPFLRCVQTSIAISAGIAQFQGSQAARASRARHTSLQRPERSSSPSTLMSIPEPEEQAPLRVLRRNLLHKPKIEKPTLRIDAFLGEWLSPDYFDLITPPPNSTMMVAGAKADLLRRGEYIEVPQVAPSNKGHFPGGWVRGDNAAAAASNAGGDDEPLASIGSLAQALPLRERASSHSSVGSNASRSSLRGATSIAKPENGLYVAPVPAYAISPSEPIPRGYVAHARDACVDVDYQWDSMREPQEWGDGGEYGEEWSSMHKRFRKGINSMADWYKSHTGGGHPIDPWCAVENDTGAEDEKETSELALILVTHGAGCNALIGALTNQPVLIDVGMASLTVAVRRRRPLERRGSSPTLLTRSAGVDSQLAETYEMRLVASTEHLRPGVDPALLGHAPSPKIAPVTDTAHLRRRFFSGSGPAAASSPFELSFNVGEPIRPGASMSAALGSIRRNSTTPSSSGSRHYSVGSSSNATASSSSSTGFGGLWSRPVVASPMGTDGATEAAGSPGRDFVLNFPATAVAKAATETKDKSEEALEETSTTGDAETENEHVSQLPTAAAIARSSSQHGLWGSKPLRMPADWQERQRGPKRRWTVNEREG